MQQIRDILDECGFTDVGYVGLPFTWCNNRPIGTVWEKIDWVVATNEWFSLFPGTRVFHLDNNTSDHISIWIVLAEL